VASTGRISTWSKVPSPFAERLLSSRVIRTSNLPRLRSPGEPSSSTWERW
jgi:hypothetical protein